VAICDYHSGRHFEDVVMKAVFDACKAKGLDAGVETEFDEAESVNWPSGKKGGTKAAYAIFTWISAKRSKRSYPDSPLISFAPGSRTTIRMCWTNSAYRF
jgi:hypothetical protein